MYRILMPLGLALSCVATTVAAQSQEEEALIRQTFAEINPLSFEKGIEYCGYVGFTASGELAVSPPTAGATSSCLADDPTNLEITTASYHTHGNFSTEYSSETPSGADMEGDEEEGIDGWVATPGGRLWYVDTTDMETYQVCGIGCLPKDPNFVEGDDGTIEQSYSYDALVARF
ncbi:DUF4329 domain-containing protein [Aestuariibius sp. HNIBRBA575]|uniref:DUF4329 domain-containing protein n=1 Tax=Aestuariibius sp. HNIBRBA575 TaxID=3233343 RepID=UPI0034A5C44B